MMNEQLQERLIQFMDKALSGVDSTVDFMSEQLPDYINQLLMWNFIHSFLMFLFPFVLSVILIKIAGRIRDNYNNLISTKDPSMFFSEYQTIPSFKNDCMRNAWIPLVFIFLLSLISLNLDWLQILVAPKVWLVEYVANLTK